jgi:acetylornithine aminotransferase
MMASQQQLLEAMDTCLIPNYGRRLRAMVRAEGSSIWDADGKEYIDFFVGFGAGGVCGHNHPAVVAAIKDQADRILSHGNFFTNERELELAQRITEAGFGGKVFFCHSGAEANEAAFKLVRLAAGEGRHRIISFARCFHGRTMGGLSLTPSKQAGFEPMVPGCTVNVEYDNLDAVRAAIDGETAGVFVEPIQGEGGIHVPSVEFMQGLRSLCDEHNLLLVVDEVWTAPARTGAWYAHQHFDITPDVMTLAKALGGGLPVGACVAAPKWADVLGPGTHGCTMGGNPICTAAAVASWDLVTQHDLLTRATALGEQVTAQLRDAAIPCLKRVRGKGLMIGMQIDKPAKEVFLAALEAGLFICLAGADVVRIAPALTVSDDDLAAGMDRLIAVLKS